jgi:hypothetical protein
MARPLSEDLTYPDEMAKRYFRGERVEIAKLGLPNQSSHMRLTARSTAPTPEDPANDHVGRFVRMVLKPHESRCLDLYYDMSLTPYLRARKLNISTKRFDKMRREILIQLKGYLAAFA